jgi:toxin ParE1/3/4
MARVTYSELAQRDIKEIVAFIAKDSPDNAQRMRAAIEERATLVATMPNMGRDRPDLGSDILSFLITQHYLLYYTKKPDGIEVVRVLETSQDIPALW